MVQVLEAPIRRTAPRRRRIWWLIPFAAVWLAILTYMLSAYVPPQITHSRVPMHGNELHFWLLVGHIATAAVATVTGFAQFVPWVRRRHPRVHRWAGRVYFFGGVFPSMVLAVPVALWAEFGISNMAGLLATDAMWAWTAIMGYRAARQRRYADHRVWMIRNFAVTLASLASRPWQILVALLVFGPLFGPMYHGHTETAIHDLASSTLWLPLAVNVLVAEVYVQRRYGVRAARRVAAAK
jgi:predicted membrane protein DUF2306